jgi:hypothetical protein
VVHLEEKYKVSINEQGRAKITDHIKTDLLTEAVTRRLSPGLNDGLIIYSFEKILFSKLSIKIVK